jgi:signal transduction histidine kinase
LAFAGVVPTAPGYLALRFDDSLDTVLAADTATAAGAQAAWRQLVDLIGRGRVPPDPAALERLHQLRDRVPEKVRASSARALEYAAPPFALVRFFALDDAETAAPVLRGARLADDEWSALLPTLTPRTRAVLRHRRDLSPAVMRALDSFGAADFVLAGEVGEALPVAAPEPPLAPDSFVSLGEAARRSLPAVAEAIESTPPKPSGPFQISELVARIAAYQRKRDLSPSEPSDVTRVRGGFHFETDAAGVVRWVEGVNRGPLIGLSLDLASSPGGSRVDGVASGAFRRRASFSSARLIVDGDSDAGGDWRIDGYPMFDPDSGRFIGYRGTARRPRSDEQASPVERAAMRPDALRQLVHELRTPTTAIAGFAEMIESQLVGPVASAYRARAATIRDQARDLLAAIDDLDLAARIEGKALDLHAGRVAVAPLIERVAGDLAPLAELRGTRVVVDAAMPNDVAGDERAVERLVGRLLAALVAAGGRDETIHVATTRDGGEVLIAFDRPAALAVRADDGPLAIDSDDSAAGEGAPLLGTGFALRLVRNLAGELGGGFTIDEHRLTLRLPAAETAGMEQASIN